MKLIKLGLLVTLAQGVRIYKDGKEGEEKGPALNSADGLIHEKNGKMKFPDGTPVAGVNNGNYAKAFNGKIDPHTGDSSANNV